MSDILVTTEQQILRITEAPRIAAEGVNENHIVFTFDESWSGYGKTVLFYRKEDDATKYISVVDGYNRALVPNAVTQTEGVFCFSLTGVKDNVEYTSEIVKYQVFPGMNATRSGSTPSPSPDVYTQIMTALGGLEDDLAAEVTAREDADTALAGDIDALANDGPVKVRTGGTAVGIGTTPQNDAEFRVNPAWDAIVGDLDAQNLTIKGEPLIVAKFVSGTQVINMPAGAADVQYITATAPTGYTLALVRWVSVGDVVPGYVHSWSQSQVNVFYRNDTDSAIPAFTPGAWCFYMRSEIFAWGTGWPT